MKCNYNKKKNIPTVFLKDVMITIHKEMAYDKFLENAMLFGEAYMPKLTRKQQELIVRVGPLSFMLAIWTIKSLNKGDDMAITPITADLLELYGVTKQAE